MEVIEGDERVQAGVLPAALDRWDEPAGDHFACRYEAYLTDPRSERLKTKWHVELTIRIADGRVVPIKAAGKGVVALRVWASYVA